MTRTGERKWLWIGVAVGVAYLIGPRLFAPLFALAGGLAALAFGLAKLGIVALGIYALFSILRGRSAKKQPVPIAPVTAPIAGVAVDAETELEREHRVHLAELDRELDKAIKEKAMTDARKEPHRD